MIAYRIPGVVGDGHAWVKASRLAPMGGWTIRRESAGILIHQGQSWTLADAGAQRQTAEGWTYFGPKEVPSIHDLTKPVRPDSCIVRTVMGTPILVPVALCSPRSLVFDPGKDARGKASMDWARRAMEAWTKQQADEDGTVVTVPDAELAEIVFLALAACYRLTQELLTDLQVLTTADLVPILLGIWGYDPKASAVAGGESPSPAAATTCPSPAPTSPDSPIATGNAA